MVETLGWAETKKRPQVPGKCRRWGLRTVPQPRSLTDPGQVERLRQALRDWSMGSPLEPLRFEKVGAQAGLKGQAGEIVGEDQELRRQLWSPLAWCSSQWGSRSSCVPLTG